MCPSFLWTSTGRYCKKQIAQWLKTRTTTASSAIGRDSASTAKSLTTHRTPRRKSRLTLSVPERNTTPCPGARRMRMWTRHAARRMTVPITVPSLVRQYAMVSSIVISPMRVPYHIATITARVTSPCVLKTIASMEPRTMPTVAWNRS